MFYHVIIESSEIPILQTRFIFFFDICFSVIEWLFEKYDNTFVQNKWVIFHELDKCVEHLIALLTPQCFQNPLTPKMFPVWDFVVGIFARKALFNMGRVLSTLIINDIFAHNSKTVIATNPGLVSFER